MEGFFRFCSSHDEKILKELLLRKYDYEFILSMDADEFIEFAEYAIEKDEKDEYKKTWNSVYPFMVTGSIKYMSFNEFYETSTGRNIDLRPTNEIRREIEELHRQAKGG